MKIGFYIDNNFLKKIDMSMLEYGNPGIGGSEYMILSLVHELSKKNQFEITLFSKEPLDLTNINNVLIEDLKNIFIQSNECEIDLLVLKYIQNISFLDIKFNTKKINFVLWAHNIIPNYQLAILSKNQNLKALVCVSKEQQDLFRDNKIFYKSTYIYNGIYEKQIENDLLKYNDRDNEVTYIGSIVAEKGFHILAKAWPKVLKKVPNAKLNVIGTGKLYNKNSKLGQYKIAEENYEKSFMPFLTKDNGDILDSVKFWGILGKEKKNILKKTKVGVPNPSGLTETFCLSAVEMQLNGCLVISKKYVGLLETVLQPSKLLYNTDRKLHLEIIEALNTKKEINISEVQKQLLNKFSFEIIIQKWIDLFEKIESKEMVNNDFQIKNLFYNFKWLREFNRIIKKNIPFCKNLPELDTYLHLISKYLKVRDLIKY